MTYFYDNKYLQNLNLSVDNLGLLRGYSAFEYLRTYNKKPFCLMGHLHRFLYSMEKMQISCPYSIDELANITEKLISLEPGECGVKWFAIAGKSQDGLKHSGLAETFAFTVPTATIPSIYYTLGINVETIAAMRPLPEAKTTAYFPACHKLSLQDDIQEIIYTDSAGGLLEGATSNLFIIRNNTIYTAKENVLHGITREVVLRLIENRFPIKYENFPYSALNTADEMFITATNKEIMPVKKIDGFNFEIGPFTKEIMSIFREFTMDFSKKDYIPLLYNNPLLYKL